ncbi:endonuclease/exonuclease/phosphatase family protein [Rhizohabitans arisaemae]|uniref:endonuclease/exonuclease/phosphatase family protein n=1 Tax=Rhizohabitans arisaemae TaxID=2720610 RepID=UPI0024B0FF9B|nr:endonuclease/exonuclease/phosphatase family protein [Rhizohabitans arisaemae]
MLTDDVTASDQAPGRRARRGVLVYWAILAPFALWAVVRTFGVDLDVIAFIMAFTPYAGLGSLIVLAIVLRSRGKAPIAVALATVLAFGFAITPRLLPEGNPGTGEPLRILTANLKFGQADPAGVVELVRRLRPDVLSVQEITPELEERLDTAGLKTLLPYRVMEATWGASGTGVYATRQLTKRTGLFTPVGHNMPVAQLRTEGGRTVEIVAVHPYAPVPGTVDVWAAGLRALPPATGGYRILAGDFNATEDHRIFRDILATGYTDAADAVGSGLTPTWPVGGLPALFMIDHILVDRRFSISGAEIHPIPGSDHRAVFADLRVR